MVIIDGEFKNKEVRNYAQKGIRSQGAVNRIKEYLRSKGFEKIDEINDTVVASVERFPNLSELRRDIERVEHMDTIKRLPPSIREIQRAGGNIPPEMEFEMMVRRGEMQPVEPESVGPWENVKNREVKGLDDTKTTKAELLEQDDGETDEYTINGSKYTIEEMREEILSQLHSLKQNWPRGMKFDNDYDIIEGQIESMSDRGILNLFYEYDSGFLFRDIFDYDSEGDNMNTRGIYSLKRDVARAAAS